MSEQLVPYLTEHQAPESVTSNNPSTYSPDAETKKTIKMVEKIYNKAKKARKSYDQNWLEFYKAFRGKQWKEVRPSYRHSEVINLVFQTIQSMIPILTDSRPKLEFLPTIPSQFQLADILSKVADNDWQHNNWLMTLCEILLDGHIYGTGFGYCGHDSKANHGLGNTLFESGDPFYCFPDPAARDINERRCRSFVYAEPVDIGLVKKEYPDVAQYIKGDVIDLAQGNKTDLDQITFKSPVETRLTVEGSSNYDIQGREQAIKITLYLHDDEMDETEEDDLNNDGTPILDDKGEPKKKYVQKLKYPNGRKIVVVSGVLCEDGPLEFEDGLFPYFKYTNYILPREFWGVGDVEPILGPQKTLNKLVSFTLDVMTLMGNPIWKVGSGANIDTDNLFNKPGLVVECDDVNQVQREEGVQLQSFIMQLIDRYQQEIKGISGQTDISQGATPGESDMSGQAISLLQQAQQTRLRMKSRNIDAMLTQFGKMYLSRVFQFYTLPRIIRVTGNDGADQFFNFHVESQEQPDGSVKRVAHVQQHDPVTKQPGEPQQIEIIGDFDVRVSTGSTLPFAKEQRANLSMQLFKLGVIDDEQLLKDMEYPNYEAVLQRLAEKKAAMAQQAAAQGAPPPPAGPQPTPPQAA